MVVMVRTYGGDGTYIWWCLWCSQVQCSWAVFIIGSPESCVVGRALQEDWFVMWRPSVCVHGCLIWTNAKWLDTISILQKADAAEEWHTHSLSPLLLQVYRWWPWTTTSLRERRSQRTILPASTPLSNRPTSESVAILPILYLEFVRPLSVSVRQADKWYHWFS